MQASSIRTPSEAFAYLGDCILATVSRETMKTSRHQKYLAYNLGLALTVLKIESQLCVDVKTTRAEDIIPLPGSIEENLQDWADRLNTGEKLLPKFCDIEDFDKFNTIEEALVWLAAELNGKYKEMVSKESDSEKGRQKSIAKKADLWATAFSEEKANP